MEYKIEHRSPSVNEYHSLRKSVGWPLYEDSLAQEGLQNSLFSVCILSIKNEIIGMGRIVGDNAIYFHIQDVIVRPEYQQKGVGGIIMKALMQYIDDVAGKNSNIGLMCSKGREKFYSNLGFTERPNEKFGAGMIMIK